MKRIVTTFFILSSFIACSRDGRKAESEGNKEIKLKVEAFEIAVSYAMGKFSEPKKITDKSGVINVSDSKPSLIIEPLRYVISPASVFTGFIDEDQHMDAIVSISSYKGQYLIPSEHLILSGTEGKPVLNRVFESDMRILGIKEYAITAEIRTHPPGSPLYNCESCKEVVKYRFLRGDLIRAE